MNTEKTPTPSPQQKLNPLFPFISLGSLIYAFFYTLFLYQNHSGITYPFFVGGTCLFFFCYLKKCGLTAGKDAAFVTVSMLLLGFSTCMTDSWILIFLNKAGIFCLFFYLALTCLYQTRQWNLGTWFKNILNIVFSSLAFLPCPFRDFSLYRQEKNTRKTEVSKTGKYILLGLLIALPLLWITLLMLSSADAVFGNFLGKILTIELDEYWTNHAVKITALFLCAFFYSYCLLNRFYKHDLKESIPSRRNGEPIIAITFTVILAFIYGLFCLIQIVFLFGGAGSLPEGYTYSSYAREGFFQLVFVCLLNLSLVLICNKYFRENKGLKIILTFICGCTYIMIASSAYRMLLYIQEYHLTFLRIFVLWALLVIALLFVGALIIIHKENFPLVRYYMLTVTLLYLILSFAHPDYWIAKYNLNQFYPLQTDEDSGENYYNIIDRSSGFYGVTKLSLDAAPAILDKVQEMEKNAQGNPPWLAYTRELYKTYYTGIVKNSSRPPAGAAPAGSPLPPRQSLRKFNFSVWIAYGSLEKYYHAHPALF